MQKLRQKFGSIYSEEEEKVLGPWQRVRQRLLSPIAALLSYLGISPDALSFSSVALGMGFFLLAPSNFPVAFWLLVISIVFDGLDGVEARLKGKSTPRGSFTDLFCDQAVVAFSVAGMAWKQVIHPVLAILFVYVARDFSDAAPDATSLVALDRSPQPHGAVYCYRALFLFPYRCSELLAAFLPVRFAAPRPELLAAPNIPVSPVRPAA